MCAHTSMPLVDSALFLLLNNTRCELPFANISCEMEVVDLVAVTSVV